MDIMKRSDFSLVLALITLFCFYHPQYLQTEQSKGRLNYRDGIIIFPKKAIIS